ncbi:MAG: hypothetical protein JNL54_14855 [Kineosporiaceae bacterium]|nr:hypothetical protein [Kineosporiaceae bacterium]
MRPLIPKADVAQKVGAALGIAAVAIGGATAPAAADDWGSFGSSSYDSFGSSSYDSFGSSSYDSFGSSSYDPFGSTSYDPFGSTTYDPFGSTSYDPFGSSSYDPFGSSSYDPFGSSSYDPFGSTSYDPFGSSSYDPFGSTTYDPFGSSSYDPFGSSTYNPFSSIYHDPFGTGYNPFGVNLYDPFGTSIFGPPSSFDWFGTPSPVVPVAAPAEPLVPDPVPPVSIEPLAPAAFEPLTPLGPVTPLEPFAPIETLTPVEPAPPVVAVTEPATPLIPAPVIPAPTPATQRAVGADGRPIVTVWIGGDSLASGEGASLSNFSTIEVPGPDGTVQTVIDPAHRASNAAGVQAVQLLQQQYPGYSFQVVNGAVSGATTATMAAQLPGAAGADIVLFSAGGNDARFGPSVIDVLLTNQTTSSQQLVTQAGQIAAGALPGPNGTSIDVQENVAGVLRQLSQTLPANSQIVVMNYPQMLPTTISPTATGISAALIGQAEVDAINQHYLPAVNTSVDGGRALAILDTGRTIILVDRTDSLTGHELLGGGQEAVNGISLPNLNGSYHPNDLGQTLMAPAIAAGLDRAFTNLLEAEGLPRPTGPVPPTTPGPAPAPAPAPAAPAPAPAPEGSAPSSTSPSSTSPTSAAPSAGADLTPAVDPPAVSSEPATEHLPEPAGIEAVPNHLEVIVGFTESGEPLMIQMPIQYPTAPVTTPAPEAPTTPDAPPSVTPAADPSVTGQPASPAVDPGDPALEAQAGDQAPAAPTGEPTAGGPAAAGPTAAESAPAESAPAESAPAESAPAEVTDPAPEPVAQTSDETITPAPRSTGDGPRQRIPHPVRRSMAL